MKAERIMDAMNYLPDELLEQTDRLRQRKKNYWKPLVAVAACLCLVVGLWFLNPGLKAANGAAPESDFLADDAGAGSINQESGSTAGIVARVYEVHDEYILVQYVYANGFCDGIPQKVSLEELEQIPVLKAGQLITIYAQQSADPQELEAYKIIIEED